MAQPLSETQIKRVEDAVALATASIDQSTRPLQEASQTLGELKLKLERAKAGAVQGLSTPESYTCQAVETARAGEDAARRALRAKEDELASLEKELRAARASLEQASDQRKAVDAFLKHLQGDSLVSAPSVQEMTSLHMKCKESSTSQVLPALPPIIVSAGHLPGPWSYLSFASRRVLMDNRFNSVITPAVSFDLPWVFDALDRVTKEVVASTEPIPAVVLVILLQGIAYVQAAVKMASKDVVLTPKPSALLQALSDSDNVCKSRESVVGMVHEQVKRFIHDGTQIESWIPITVFTGERLSSANSALPEGVVLAHKETPGTIFMIRNAVDKEQIFIIEAKTVYFKWVKYPIIEMCLPSIDGLPNDSRNMMLMNDVEQRHVSAWAYAP